MKENEFKKFIKKNPGKCEKMDCSNKVICSADYPNELCYEKFIPE